MPTTLFHCSNPNLGGAERSLLNQIGQNKKESETLFVFPGEGDFLKKVKELGYSFLVLPWPRGLSALTQREAGIWEFVKFLSPLTLGSWLIYSFKFLNLQKNYQELYTLGVKSHVICLLLNVLSAKKLTLSVRDFIRPKPLRALISAWAGIKGYRVEVNSQRVGRDYQNPIIIYPTLAIGEYGDGRPKKKDLLTVVHLAYFAPYKGQLEFIEIAKRMLESGIQAEFILAGDIIYSGKSYQKYKEKIRERIEQNGLSEMVKLVGEIKDPKDFLLQSHLLIHCTSEPEPFGRVVAEALLCGCDVICHRENGVLEIIEAGFKEIKEHMAGKFLDETRYCYLEAKSIRFNKNWLSGINRR